MTTEELIALRKALGLTQTEFAARLGMTMRGYQDIETGKSGLRPIYALGAERVALAIAVERGEINLAPAAVRRDALALARLITG